MPQYRYLDKSSHFDEGKMTKQKKTKKTKSPAIAGRLPLRDVADEQQDSGGDTPQKEKKSSRLAKASWEEEPEEVVDLDVSI